MFLDKKTLLKIWLNPAFKELGPGYTTKYQFFFRLFVPFKGLFSILEEAFALTISFTLVEHAMKC